MTHSRDLLAQLRSLAESASRAGGRVALSYFRQSVSVQFKDDGSEVSTADHAAQDAVIRVLRDARPSDRIVAEETIPDSLSLSTTRAHDPSAFDRLPASVFWIIDPIDGTRNFLRGFPLFCCSVAAMIDGFPVAGAVFDPASDILYSAHAGSAATANGRPCVVRQAAPHLPLLVSIPSKQRRIGACDHWPREVVVRGLGTTALQLALVAAGQLDASYANDGKLWDIAAGFVLVTAAGGTVTLPDGSPIFPVDPARYAREELPTLAAAPSLHPRLIIPSSTSDPASPRHGLD